MPAAEGCLQDWSPPGRAVPTADGDDDNDNNSDIHEVFMLFQALF